MLRIGNKKLFHVKQFYLISNDYILEAYFELIYMLLKLILIKTVSNNQIFMKNIY